MQEDGRVGLANAQINGNRHMTRIKIIEQAESLQVFLENCATPVTIGDNAKLEAAPL